MIKQKCIALNGYTRQEERSKITCQTKKRVNSSRMKEISFKEQNLMKRKWWNNREKEHAKNVFLKRSVTLIKTLVRFTKKIKDKEHKLLLSRIKYYHKKRIK